MDTVNILLERIRARGISMHLSPPPPPGKWRIQLMLPGDDENMFEADTIQEAAELALRRLNQGMEI